MYRDGYQTYEVTENAIKELRSFVGRNVIDAENAEEAANEARMANVLIEMLKKYSEVIDHISDEVDRLNKRMDRQN